MNISDFKGKVKKCFCTNADPNQPMPCNDCFCRGYVAECLGCMGTGQKEEPVAGGNGTMKSTCSVCGGKGKMGTNKPADWDITHPPIAEIEAETEEEVSGEQKPNAESVEEVVSVA